MVKFYSGTPGSGKSFHTAQDIRNMLRAGRNVISTVDIDIKRVSGNGRRRIGDFVYKPITELNTDFLYRYAMKNHKKAKEGQTLVVIDECQIIFNSRDCQDREVKKQRIEWILFFSRHRHLGFNVILISQQDRMIDRQIRGMFEYEFKHRKVNNFGFLFLIPITIFVVIEYWYGNKVRIGASFVRYKRRIAKIYDSYTMYDDFIEKFRDEYGRKTPLASASASAGDELDELTEVIPLARADGGRGSPSERARVQKLRKIREILNKPIELPMLQNVFIRLKKPIQNAPIKAP